MSVFAALSAHLIPVSSFPANTTFGSVDYYTSFLLGVFKPASANQVVEWPMFQLLYFAYSFGFFVTFINLLPAWQLDGGHIANSAVSPRVHQYLTYASVAIMFLTGLLLMAILVLFLSGRAPSLRPLDDVSPLSNSRKVLFHPDFGYRRSDRSVCNCEQSDFRTRTVLQIEKNAVELSGITVIFALDPIWTTEEGASLLRLSF